jgi:hypothetical protein
MHIISFEAEYAIGDQIEIRSGVRYRVLGFSYVPGRGLRYICMPNEYTKSLDRIEFYGFEIKGKKEID